MPRHSLSQVSKLLIKNRLGAVRYMSQHFRVVEHNARCQHTRDRPAGVEFLEDNSLRLAVKQYIPKDNPFPGPEDVTLIGAHANAFPKEIYEPLWDDIHEILSEKGRKIRSVWIADVYSQGKSGVLNEKLLGNDPSWWDHGRDLLALINQFQDEIPHPIIGVGHSMGASQLAHLSLMHPRLLDALVLIDPTIQSANPSTLFAPASTYRRDVWPSRSEAAAKFASSKFYQRWDPRVLEKWIEFGLRELPTEQYPDAKQNDRSTELPVTLTTTKAQEVFYFLRPAYHEDRKLGAMMREEEMHLEDRDDSPMYRPEPAIMFRDLERLRPSTLYIFGATSELSDPVARKQKIDRTGAGVGGSGGKDKGKIEEVVLNSAHLVPMEQTRACAEATVTFMDKQLCQYDDVTRQRQAQWDRLSRKERAEINDEWRLHIQKPPRRGLANAERPLGKL